MIVSPCMKFWCPKCWNQLLINFRCLSACKKSFFISRTNPQKDYDCTILNLQTSFFRHHSFFFKILENGWKPIQTATEHEIYDGKGKDA